MRNITASSVLLLTLSSVLFICSVGCNGAKTGETFGSMAVPIAGKCGTTVNTCDAGTLLDTADTTTEYLWRCNSPNGGLNASCTLPIPDNPSGSSDGLGDDTQFYVGVNADVNTIAHVRNVTGFSTKCAIDKASLANEDIECIIDIPEGEAYANALTLRYNIPPNMCRYLRRQTYWFYNQEVGIGPKTVEINMDFDDDPGPTAVLTAYTCSVDGKKADGTPGFGPCSGFSEINFSISGNDQQATCVYDKSKSSVGKNCCFGKYTATVNKIYQIQADTSQTSEGSWGGTFNDCIGGPGKTWKHKSAQGVPISVIDLVKDGYKKDYALPAAVDTVVDPVSFLAANYFDPVLHTHAGIIDVRTTTLPYFLDPVDDRNGTSIPTTTFDPDNFLIPGNESYSFECLDEGFDVKHRIRAYVREWDAKSDFLEYISTQGVTENPDIVDDGPVDNCNVATGFCNDFYDLDDFLKLNLGLPGYTAPNPLVRDSYFPNLKYK